MSKLYRIREAIDPDDIKYFVENCLEEVESIPAHVIDSDSGDEESEACLVLDVSRADFENNHTIIDEDVLIVRKEATNV